MPISTEELCHASRPDGHTLHILRRDSLLAPYVVARDFKRQNWLLLDDSGCWERICCSRGEAQEVFEARCTAGGYDYQPA